MNTVIRKHKFDMGHRLVSYNGPCRHAHGHEYHIEIACEYDETNELGLGIDFADIKRKFCTWIDTYLDHGFACNKLDVSMSNLLRSEGNKLFFSQLGNPSAENLSKELFYVGEQLLNSGGLRLSMIRLWETMNCYVETFSLSESERKIFEAYYGKILRD